MTPYKNHKDYAGEVDHAQLLQRLSGYDGWILHTSSTALGYILTLCPSDVRVMAWVKPFAAFKRNVSVAYAWEPVIVKAARKPVVRGRVVMRDWIAEPITMKKGLTGAKPRNVARWAFEMLGAEPIDSLDDLYPGTDSVSNAWHEWVWESSNEINVEQCQHMLIFGDKKMDCVLEDDHDGQHQWKEREGQTGESCI